MSIKTPYIYLNNVIYSLSSATPHLVHFYQTKKAYDWGMAMIKGGHTSLLFAGLHDEKLLPHISIEYYLDWASAIEELSTEENDNQDGELSIRKTLKNFDIILESWTELHNKTLQLLLQELAPHRCCLEKLEGNNLRDYCRQLLPYDESGKSEYMDHFIGLVYAHIKKEVIQKIA